MHSRLTVGGSYNFMNMPKKKQYTLKNACAELIYQLDISSEAQKAILKNILIQTIEYHISEYGTFQELDRRSGLK